MHDTYSTWREARIVELNQTQLKVHYRGYTHKWDEWLHKHSDRIREIGSMSPAFGRGDTNTRSIKSSQRQPQTKISDPNTDKTKEALFSLALAQRSLLIHPIEGDGNCLFRSVSHQLYGCSSFHVLVRQKALEYMSIEREYFFQFIEGGLSKFEEYLEHQRCDGAWGDDIEIQAMSEIYDRPFELYAYAARPMKTFHESSGCGAPLRLSYHGQCHYNSIVSKDKQAPLLLTLTPGLIEDESLQRAHTRELRTSVHLARESYERSEIHDIEEALQVSLQEPCREDDLDLITALSMSSIEYATSLGLPYAKAMEALSIVGDDPERVVEYILNMP